MSMSVWLEIPVLFFAMVGLVCMVSAAVKVWRRRPKKPHPLARRPATTKSVLLDEPPAQCPVCGTPCVMVKRGEYTPPGSPFRLQNTEHFVCENGDRFLGPKQTEMTNRRIEARRKLRAVVDVKAAVEAQEQAEEYTRAKHE